MRAHRFAQLFPPLPPDELRELTADIRAHGQREPITVYEGQILDGMSRAAACAQLGKRPKTRTFRGSEAEAFAFVVSINVRRRHLTESQRAMVAARLATLKWGQRPAKSGPRAAVTQRQAGAALRVSTRTVRRALYVQRHGAPSEARAVERGDLTLKAVERALRHRRKDVDDGRERDARQLTQYVRRLPDTANAFVEMARRVVRLAGDLSLRLEDCLNPAARKVVADARTAAESLLSTTLNKS